MYKLNVYLLVTGAVCWEGDIVLSYMDNSLGAVVVCLGEGIGEEGEVTVDVLSRGLFGRAVIDEIGEGMG